MRQKNHIVLILLLWALGVGGFAQAKQGYFAVADFQSFLHSLSNFTFGKGLHSEAMQPFLSAPRASVEEINKLFHQRYALSPLLVAEILDGRIECYYEGSEFTIAIGYVDAAAAAAILDKITVAMGTIMEYPPAFVGVAQHRVLRAGRAGENLFVLEGERLMAAAAFSAERAEELLEKLRQRSSYRSSPAHAVFYSDPRGELYENRALRPYAKLLESLALPGVSAPSLAELNFNAGRIDASITHQNSAALLPLLADGALSPQLLSWLPSGVDSAVALHLRWDHLLPFIREQIAATGDSTLKAELQLGLTFLKMAAAVDLEEGLLAQLQPGVVIGMLPQSSGGGFPLFSGLGLGSTFAVVQMREGQRAHAEFKKLFAFMGKLAAKDGVGGGLRSVLIGTQRVDYIKYYAGMISPCMAVVGNDIIVTTNIALMRTLLGEHGNGDDLRGDLDFTMLSRSLRGFEAARGFVYQRYREVPMGVAGGLSGVVMASFLRSTILPHISEVSQEVDRSRVLISLRSFGALLQRYRRSRDGRGPSSLAELLYREEIDPAIFEIDLPKVRFLAIHGKRQREPQLYYPMPDGEVATLYTDGSVRIHAPRSDGFVATTEAPVLSHGLGAPGDFAVQPPSQGQLFIDLLKSSGRHFVSSLDFALFPGMESFNSPRSSNIAILTVHDENLVTKARVGHLLSSANQLAYSAVTLLLLSSGIDIIF